MTNKNNEILNRRISGKTALKHLKAKFKKEFLPVEPISYNLSDREYV